MTLPMGVMPKWNRLILPMAMQMQVLLRALSLSHRFPPHAAPFTACANINWWIRDLSTFKTNVLDKLATRAWYLHNSADGRLFFKNQQNLAAKLRSTALSLHHDCCHHRPNYAKRAGLAQGTAFCTGRQSLCRRRRHVAALAPRTTGTFLTRPHLVRIKFDLNCSLM